MTRQSNWLDHALKERRPRWQPQRQVVALGTLGFFIALILGALYLSQVASEVTMNRQLSDLLEERDQLERRNEQLRVEIADLERVGELRTRAEALGFVEARGAQIEYLPVQGYAPNTADTVAPVEVVVEEDVPIYDETFTDWVGQQLDRLREALGDLLGG